jgi:hypothetical protein
MNLSGVRQNLENIDYAWNKPQTYFVFVPVLSLIIQRIQLAATLPLIDNSTPQNVAEADAKSRKFVNICKWHLRGSMLQLIFSIVALKFFSVHLFSFFVAASATCELLTIAVKSLKNRVTVYEFYSDGNVKSMTNVMSFNIF